MDAGGDAGAADVTPDELTGWELVDGARATEWKTLRGAANPFNAGLGLALLGIAHGAPDAADLHPDAPLVEWAGAIGWQGCRVEDWKRGLRMIVAMAHEEGGRTAADVEPALADLAATLAVNAFVVPRATPRGLAYLIREARSRDSAVTTRGPRSRSSTSNLSTWAAVAAAASASARTAGRPRW